MLPRGSSSRLVVTAEDFAQRRETTGNARFCTSRASKSSHAVQYREVVRPPKGYGFVNHPDEGDDVFVHDSSITSDDDFKTLPSGQHVTVEMDDGPKGLRAINVYATNDVPSPTLDTPSETEASMDEIGPSEVDSSFFG